jgi:hypothetical protein
MKYMEYLYLTAAVMLLIFLATEFEHLTTTTIIALIVAMLLFSFMFSFRRNQRIRFDRMMEEEMRKLEEEEADYEAGADTGKDT